MCAKNKDRTDAGSVVARVRAFARPAVEALSLSLWDVEFEKAGADWDLTLYIERFDENGEECPVTLEDCERASHAVDALLDEHDPITQSYNFHVSSAGLERTLKTPEQFARFVGHHVEVRLFAPAEGAKQHTGRLVDATDEAVRIETADGRTLSFARPDVARVRTQYLF